MKQHSRDQIFLTRERNNCRSSNRGYFAPYLEVLTGVIWVTIISCWRKTVYIAWINNFYIFKYYIIYMIELNTRKLYILWRSSYILSESISVCFGLLEFLFFYFLLISILFWGDPYYPGGNRYKYRTNYSNNEKIVNYFEFYYPFALTFWYNC